MHEKIRCDALHRGRLCLVNYVERYELSDSEMEINIADSQVKGFRAYQSNIKNEYIRNYFRH